MSEAIVPPQGTITLLYTDVEGSTKLSRAVPHAYKALMEAHDERLREVFVAHNGYEVDHPGDGFMVTFQHARDALACACAIQQSLHAEPITAQAEPTAQEAEGKMWTVRVRMGIYRASQEVFFENGKYRNLEVNLASRIGAPGVGGQILVSHKACEEAGNGQAYQWQHWKNRRLKDFLTPEDIHELLWEGEGTSRGEPGTRWIPKGFGIELNRYIDRSDLQAKILRHYAERLNDREKVRLVTLHGFGGMGKTRLAVACALQVASAFKDGLYFVALVDRLASEASVVEEIGRAMQVEGNPATLEQLLPALQDKAALFVLDNYESVDCVEVRDLLRDLLLTCPDARLLVTGRETVKLDNVEKEVPVAGMTDEEAERLFVERAQLKVDGWQVSSGERKWFQDILKYTECQALGLELVAAYVGKRSLQKMAEGLRDTPLGPYSGHQPGHAHSDASIRHESLTRCLDWSYTLLEPQFQEGLACLGVFGDTFTAARVEEVCQIEDAETLLDRLHEASLVNLQGFDADGCGRYTFLRPTRFYAAARLNDLPNADARRQRYSIYYAQLAMGHNNINDHSNNAVLDAEWRNAVYAAETAEVQTSWEERWQVIEYISAYMGGFLLLRGLWSEQEELNLRTLRVTRTAGQKAAEGRTLTHLGVVYNTQGRWEEAIACYEQSLPIFREFGNRIGEGQTLNNLGNVYQQQGRWEEAIACFEQDLATCREFDDRIGEGGTLTNLGNVYQQQGRWEEAIACFEQSLLLFRELKARLEEAITLSNLGVVYEGQGHWEEAIACFEQSLVIRREAGNRVGEGETLINLALFYNRQGNSAAALRWVRQALQVLETTQDTRAIARARSLVAEWEQA